MMNGGGAKEAGAGGGRWCGSMPNYHLCARATFAALNKRAGDEGGGVGCSSNFIHSFRSWRRQGLARLINFAARFLTMATFELCAISLAKHWKRGRDRSGDRVRLAGAELHFSPHLKILSFNN